MTAIEVLNLNPQHIAELKSFFKGFEFKDVEIVASEKTNADSYIGDNQTFGFDMAYKKLKFDGIFLGKNRMHAFFTGGEDDVFYCISCAKVGNLEERIIFKLTV